MNTHDPTTTYEICARLSHGRTGAYVASAYSEERAVNLAREMHRTTALHYHVVARTADPYVVRKLIFTTIADEQVRRARQGDLLK